MTMKPVNGRRHRSIGAMTCQEFIETLLQYLSGELPPGPKGEADLHLQVCPDCVSYLRSYEITVKLGKKAFADDAQAEEIPDDLVEVVLSARKRQG